MSCPSLFEVIEWSRTNTEKAAVLDTIDGVEDTEMNESVYCRCIKGL